MTEDKIFTYSPSDFAFTANCHHCFYNKYVNKIENKGGFPAVFGLLDVEQKKYFENLNTKDISKDLPNGTINKEIGGKCIKSVELKDLKGRPFKISGKADLILNLTETKSYGVIDFKTTKIDEKKADVYFYQLEAYALILENAEKKDYHLTPVTHLGLLMMQPDVITKHNKKYIFQNFKLGWMDIKRDTDKFMKYITGLQDILFLDEAPPPENCGCELYKKALFK